MRTTKRFTPKVLDRFEREGRGQGIFNSYKGWHQVTRGDPASRGRSHVLLWEERLRDLLSDGELGQQLFATMITHLLDSLEQYKLALESAEHPLAGYGKRDCNRLYPGTVEIARELCIRYPMLRDGDATAPWRMTTDLFLVRRVPPNDLQGLALAFKPDNTKLTRRQKALLRLEFEYWRRRGIPWLLITPALYERSVFLTLRRIACWVLGERAPQSARDVAVQIAKASSSAPYSDLLHRIESNVGSTELAQRALWQSIWWGHLPVDLRMSWRPYLPLRHISHAEFQALNPIACGRSSWPLT